MLNAFFLCLLRDLRRVLRITLHSRRFFPGRAGVWERPGPKRSPPLSQGANAPEAASRFQRRRFDDDGLRRRHIALRPRRVARASLVDELVLIVCRIYSASLPFANRRSFYFECIRACMRVPHSASPFLPSPALKLLSTYVISLNQSTPSCERDRYGGRSYNQGSQYFPLYVFCYKY